MQEIEAQLPVVQESSLSGKMLAITAISVVNGALYFVIAYDGGANVKNLFHLAGSAANPVIIGVGVGAGLVYTMFTYKTYESLSLKINSIPKIAFAILAPFSAAAFLTAGKEGAQLLRINGNVALGIGVSLFALRIVNSIDASVKFPERLTETKQYLVNAFRNRNYIELARLGTVWLTSIGYIASTTDPIFSAFNTIFSWIHVTQNIARPLSYAASGLGAIGTLPLIVYWGFRGLRQLTFGGTLDLDGQSKDPTDRYTYIALVLVTPVMLGILGGATASSGAVFGQLGTFSQVVRVASSILYAAFAGTPGMAMLLRTLSEKIAKSSCCKTTEEERRPLLTVNEINEPKKTTCFKFFRGRSNHNVSDDEEPRRCCNIL